MKKIVIGSRESRLAVIQSEMVRSYLKKNLPETEISLLTMKTTGDMILDRTLDKVGGKGLFVKELDRALMERRSDLSVHSLKDMPMEISEELPIIAFSKREDPRDALILPAGKTEIDFSKPIGCSSFRRILQLKELYPKASFESIRGNVQTRLKKLDDGLYGATILAAAGLKRLGLESRISRYFSPEEILPAAGQGILAVQGRCGEDYSYLKDYQDADAAVEALAERAFVAYLNGGCSSPVAAFARAEGESVHLTGLYYSEEKQIYRKKSAEGKRANAEDLGRMLAAELKKEVDG
ncbi:Porphobilinogen deaminase [uncultured Roseburia sp.]|uniref:Porphobilinogen deaminase n=1 Tax=Brotonthovivens ammoniilytica TaxID=2981725 RepID=A0ABT2TM85_9FIRM|nr:hydroxymethylbilane synthase [Brotonthovivens ammoniilytica]MCU6763330.1 hydroxymethylbilane synthase [Brotonthovivens ammoniilytica]SCJ13709.1 Porphobilinogen deaminase [uncultured Roseburia sp.]